MTLAQTHGINNSTKEARAVLCKTVARIQERWGFQNLQMAAILHIAPTTYGSWLKKGEIPVSSPPYKPETEAVIALLAIHRSLSAMFRNPNDQVLWMKSKHPNLGKVSPFEFSANALSNLFQLRAYLDYVRGRGA